MITEETVVFVEVSFQKYLEYRRVAVDRPTEIHALLIIKSAILRRVFS